MSVSSLEVRVRLLEAASVRAEAKRTAAAISGIGSAARKSGEQTAASTSHMDRLTAGTHRLRSAIGFAVGSLGIGAFAFGIKDVVTAGLAAQQSQAQLQAALRATGAHGHGAAAGLNRLNAAAGASSLHGGFATPTETQGLAQLLRQTGSVTKAIRANSEAVALARGRNIDYGSAVAMVAQAQTGNVGRLQKYLGILQPVTKYTAGWTAAMKRAAPVQYAHAVLLNKQATAGLAGARIMKLYGGATAAYGHTTAGALSNAHNALEELMRTMSLALLPVIANVARALSQVVQNVVKHWPQIKKTILDVTRPIVDVLKWLVGTKSAVKALGVAAGIAAGGWVAYTVAIKAAALWSKLMATSPLLLGLTLLAVGFVELYTHVAAFRSIVGAVFDWMRGAAVTVVGFIKTHWLLLTAILFGPFVGLAAFVATHFQQVKKAITGFGGWVGKTAASIWGGIKKAFIDVINWIIRAWDSLHFSLPKIDILGVHIGGGTIGVPHINTIGGTTEGVKKHLAAHHHHPGSATSNRNASHIEIHPGKVELKLDSRVLAEAVVHHALKLAATGGHVRGA